MEENKARTYILEYLREHPQASDTLEGITRWWLVSQQVNYSVMVVMEVLEQLKAEGLIVGREIGGKLVYLAKDTESSGIETSPH